MSFTTKTGELSPTRIAPDAMLRAPVGFASPLWGVFTGVALTGVAWWWATQWMRPPVAEGLTEGMAETAEAGPALVEPILDAVIAPELPALAVGGESAPIAPTALVAEEPAHVEAAPSEDPVALASVEAPVTPEPAPPPVMMEAVGAEIFELPPVIAEAPKPKKPRARRISKASAPVVDPVSVEEPSTMEAASEAPGPAASIEEPPRVRRANKQRTPKGRHRRQARKRLT
jgi:hypothetical protein